MNFIITGGSGFIGSHLTQLLARRYPDTQIFNIDIAAPVAPEKAQDAYPALKEGESLASVHVGRDVREEIKDLPFTPTPDDVIFHLAAIHRTPGYEDHEYFDTNVAGARNVVAFAEKWGIKKILFTSSIDVYGASEQLKTEEYVPNPQTAYGKSKLEAERIHREWQKADPENRRLVILRPGVVFGKGENGNFTRLYRSLRKGRFAYPGRKDTIKASIYVKDLVNFMDFIVNNSVNPVELYNCCYSPAHTIEEIVETMKSRTGLKRRVPTIPGPVVMGAAHLARLAGSPMGICPARVRKLQVSTNADGSAMLKTGYKFEYGFEKAMTDWHGDNDNRWLV